MDWRYNTIWFEQIPTENFLKLDLKAEKSGLSKISDVEYAILWYYRYKEKAFDQLPQSDKLLYLQLNSANIKDFDGIEKFSKLKRLEVHHCLKIENDFGLSRVADTLEYFHINQSKKLSSLDEIIRLSNLKVLCLNNCGPLENLNFLKCFLSLLISDS